jgi:GTP-binding protein
MSAPKITSAEYQASVLKAGQMPRDQRPEVAFLGRSNVGKSSLINTLLGRRRLVRTSARPGCTRALNFFLINQSWYFVDLPGFGYAAVSKDLRQEWGRLILDYLAKRETLAAVVFLQDGRRQPGPEELFLWDYLTSRGRVVIPVLTKADKLRPGQRPRRLQEITAALAEAGVSGVEPLWFSAVSHEGRNRLWARILEAVSGGNQ